MIKSHYVLCPYCGETFEALIDTSVESQEYVEDCEVCCRPIVFNVNVEPTGSVVVEARHEDEA